MPDMIQTKGKAGGPETAVAAAPPTLAKFNIHSLALYGSKGDKKNHVCPSNFADIHEPLGRTVYHFFVLLSSELLVREDWCQFSLAFLLTALLILLF